MLIKGYEGLVSIRVDPWPPIFLPIRYPSNWNYLNEQGGADDTTRILFLVKMFLLVYIKLYFSRLECVFTNYLLLIVTTLLTINNNNNNMVSSSRLGGPPRIFRSPRILRPLGISESWSSNICQHWVHLRDRLKNNAYSNRLKKAVRRLFHD